MNNYQWYPGHMAKALRAMKEDIKLIDVLLEMTDARAPESTRNPNIVDLAKDKIHIIVLNKKDMADDKVTNKWLDYYKEQGITAIAIDAKQKSDIKKVNALIEAKVKEASEGIKTSKTVFLESAGINKAETIRIMVSGIPNVGKSTFINSFSGRASTKTGNKPGVTRGKQWIRLREGRDLLDTPGIHYVKPTSNESGMHLAFIGSLNDNNLDLEELALDLSKWTMDNYPGKIEAFYGVSINDSIKDEDEKSYDDYYYEEMPEGLKLMDAVGKKRGAIRKGGLVDYERTAKMMLDDFRDARWGRISLDFPEHFSLVEKN